MITIIITIKIIDTLVIHLGKFFVDQLPTWGAEGLGFNVLFMDMTRGTENWASNPGFHRWLQYQLRYGHPYRQLYLRNEQNSTSCGFCRSEAMLRCTKIQVGEIANTQMLWFIKPESDLLWLNFKPLKDRCLLHLKEKSQNESRKFVYS